LHVQHSVGLAAQHKHRWAVGRRLRQGHLRRPRPVVKCDRG
jgi:hypothetical protein